MRDGFEIILPLVLFSIDALFTTPFFLGHNETHTDTGTLGQTRTHCCCCVGVVLGLSWARLGAQDQRQTTEKMRHEFEIIMALVL